MNKKPRQYTEQEIYEGIPYLNEKAEEIRKRGVPIVEVPTIEEAAKPDSAEPTQDADTPEELARWIWNRFVGCPIAGKGWEQEYEFLLDRVKRMERSAYQKGLKRL